MTDDTMVILAAGRGSRMGRVGADLHKALVPLCEKAIISHIIDDYPRPIGKLIICTGYHADQVRTYMRLAHPDIDVTYVHVTDWDVPGAGPGASLYEAKDQIPTDAALFFTSCDTLIKGTSAWPEDTSAVAVAPIPVGTKPERWCRVSVGEQGYVNEFVDKAYHPKRLLAYTGAARIVPKDLDGFWSGIECQTITVENESQVTPGLELVYLKSELAPYHVMWTDIGDEAAYRRAVAEYSGYDWVKSNEATFVLRETGRVVKYWGESKIALERAARGWALNGTVPRLVDADGQMLAYEYVDGETAYTAAEDQDDLIPRIFEWASTGIWHRTPVRQSDAVNAAFEFYAQKTYDRIGLLETELARVATDAVDRLDFSKLCRGVQPRVWHGDLNFGNIVVTPNGRFVGIDWRQDFAGNIYWGDRRYDLAKLLGGCIINWEWARRGDFAPWPRGVHHAKELHRLFADDDERDQVIIITALHLINSAPLHAAPLDEVLVYRAVTMLEELT